MLSPKHKLVLAATAAASLLVCLVATSDFGETHAAGGTLKAKILRRHDKAKLKPTAQELDLLRTQASPKEERKLDDTIPKHVPIKVKIKADKEKAFKDLNNENWLRDLEIEVKNTGNKPIYFLVLAVDLPDTRGPDGNIIGWDLHYGRTDLIEITAPLKPEDVPIKPGETYIFTIAERFVRGWQGLARAHQITQPKRVQVIFQFVNFGDGTGFWGGTAAPLPHPKSSVQSAGPCTTDAKMEHAKDPAVKWPMIALNHSERFPWLNALPAYWPADFLSTESWSAVSINTSVDPDTCCPGTSCTWAKQSFTRCYCSSIDDPEIQDKRSVEFPGCTDSTGACSTITYRTEWCDFPNVDGTTFRLSCQLPIVFSCFDYDPPPPPPPSPVPASPTPTPTPTPTPACPQPTPAPVCLPSETPVWMPYPSCHWTCSLSQPPNVSGSPIYYGDYYYYYNFYNYNDYCTPYIWVWYVSYDGGETWEATGETEYAGCW